MECERVDYNKNYNRCRQFTPPGWGTARMLAPCYRRGRPVQFQATLHPSCRPAYQPIIVPAKSGINEARDPDIRPASDECHGRKFCPPSNMSPVNVHLKMCPVSNSGPQDDSCGGDNGNGEDSCGGGGGGMSGQGSYGGGGSGRQIGPSYATKNNSCPSNCPLPRCPPGIKVARTLPIIPFRRLQESAYKMPSSSVYQADYIKREGTPTKSFAPDRSATQSSGEFEKLSLTHRDFVPQPTCPYKKPPWAFRKDREESCQKMAGISCYKTDYPPKKGEAAISAKPVRFIDAELPPVDDRTVYQVEFIAHPLDGRVDTLKEKAQADGLRVHCVPFDGLTIYKRDYIPKFGKPALSVVDKDKRFAKDMLPMDGTTTYKASYGPFYFDDIDCIPADIYDCMYPPKDKCAAVRCYPEAERYLENPIQGPVPPCRPPADKPYCPTPREMRCNPRVTPCVAPYTIKKEAGDNCTVIRVEHNVDRKHQEEGIIHDCPPRDRPCKSY